MQNIRTDLAIEAHEMCTQDVPGNIDGVTVDKNEQDGVSITRITIENEKGVQALGKPKGTYVTIEAPDIKYDVEVYEKTCMLMAEEIRKMADIRDDTLTLVVGLGNREVTPDALGPDVVAQLMVTNHMKQYMKEFLDEGIGSVCAIAPGVLGTTGIETAQIIKGVVDQVHPGLVIAVDALASRSLGRISTTFQIADTGINPGSGVGNNRNGLNEKTLGTKVIAVGVPTVVDAATIARDSVSILQEESDSTNTEDVAKRLYKDIEGLMVTPKDIDLVIEKTAKTVANGINMALHKDLTFEEIESFVG